MNKNNIVVGNKADFGNLQQSPFEEKTDLVAKLGLKILPTEDLKSRKIHCRLNFAEVNREGEQTLLPV